MINKFKKYYVSQVDEADCGVAVLSMMLRFYGSNVSLATLRNKTKTTKDGTTAFGIIETAKEYKLQAEAYQADMSLFDAQNIKYPFIAHIYIKEQGLLHYCIVISKKSNSLIIADPDPSKKVHKVSLKEFQNKWTGVAIFINPSSSYKLVKEEKKKINIIYPVLAQKKTILKIIFASLVVTLISIISSLFIQELLDVLIPQKLENPLSIIGIGLLIAYLINSIFEFTRDYLIATLGQNLSKSIIFSYIKHIFKLPMAFFLTRKTGDITSRFSDASKVIDALVSAIMSVFLDITMIIIIGLVLALQSIKLFLIMTLVIPIYIVTVLSFNKIFEKENRDQMESNAKLSSSIIEDIRGIETLKSLNSEKERIDKIEHEFNDYLSKSLKYERDNNLQQSIKSFIHLTMSLIILWVGAKYVIDGNLSVGELMAFNALMVYFISPLQNIINLQPKIQSALVANNRLNEVFMVESEFNNQIEHNLPKDIKQIKFSNVGYRYDYSNKVLQNLDIVVTKGEKLTIVGMSGSGKSTMMKLLVNYIQPTSGKILINGQDINSINKMKLRSLIKYVPQTPYVFSGTIKENLLLGSRKGLINNDIVKACKIAMIDDDIKKMPLGYNTKLDEEGRQLSGGQRQRLTIARAILSEAKVLIFDESTSGLDSITEEKLVNNIMKLTDKTVIFVAHRLSIAKATNNVLVIDDGKVVEKGSHTKLMKEKRNYYHLVKKLY